MTSLTILILVLAGIVGLAVIVLAIVLLLWRKAQLLAMQAAVTRVEFLRISRAYGNGRG